MRRNEQYTIEQRMEEKRRQARANQKRRERGLRVDSEGKISNWT